MRPFWVVTLEWWIDQHLDTTRARYTIYDLDEPSGPLGPHTLAYDTDSTSEAIYASRLLHKNRILLRLRLMR